MSDEIAPALTPANWVGEIHATTVVVQGQPFTREDVALLQAAADWANHDGTDGACPRCGNVEWKMSAPPICVGCGYYMPRRPHPNDLRALATRLGAILPKEP